MKIVTDKVLEKSEKEKKQNYTGSHCCFVMDYSVDKSQPENESPCFYNSKFRRYYLKAIHGSGSRKIDFCPYCGTKLPQDLSDIWFDIIEKEFGLDPWLPKQRKKIPSEYQTDEWWKKRGL